MYRSMFYHPWGDLRNLKKDIHRVVNDVLGIAPEWEGGYWRPSVDMIETDDSFILAVELPGMKREDIQINLVENNLSISGERKPLREDRNQLRSEFCYGPFKRSIPIPAEANLEKITAKYDNGILQVILPKKERSKAKEIKIEVN